MVGRRKQKGKYRDHDNDQPREHVGAWCMVHGGTTQTEGYHDHDQDDRAGRR